MTTDYVKTPINFISFAFLLTIFSAANLYSRIFYWFPGKRKKNANWNHVHYYKHLLFGYRKRPKWCCIKHVFITSIWFLFFGFFPNLCISTNDSDVQFMKQKKPHKKWKNYYHHQNDNNNWFLCRYSATMIDLQCFRCKCSIMSRAGAQRRPILSAKKW